MKIPEIIIIKLNVQDNLPKINLDPFQMQQVFQNLISNAVEAMPDGGTLEIKAMHENSQIELSFKDAGIGIKNENLKNIFDPLFTTKKKGIGLGLSIVDEILRTHDSEIAVESEIGMGTTFTIKLPINLGAGVVND